MGFNYKKLLMRTGGKKTYADKILNIAQANLIGYWPLWEAVSPNENYLTFNGSTTVVNLGSGATLDDRQDAVLCVDGWFNTSTSGPITIIAKSDNTEGWYVCLSSGTFIFKVFCATTNTSKSLASGLNDGAWHHFVGYFDDAGGADRKAYIAIDGVWEAAGPLAVDAIITDAALDLRIGSLHSGVWDYTGNIGWIRISDNDRFTHGTPFTPPVRDTVPVVDANTVGLWPMNEGYGTVAGDLSANGNDGTITDGSWGTYPIADNYEGTAARDGAYTGVTLGQVQTPFTAPLFDGVNDYVDIYSASFASAFNGAAGTVVIACKVRAGSVWTDAATRMFITIQVNSNNFIRLSKSSTNNRIDWQYKAGGTAENINDIVFTSIEWFQMALTWDKAAEEVKAYFNGLQVGATAVALGIWAGSPASTATLIGGLTKTSGLWDGLLAHCAVWTKALSAVEIAELASYFLATTSRYFLAFGDSKTEGDEYQNELGILLNSAQTVVTWMYTTLASGGDTVAIRKAVIDADIAAYTDDNPFCMLSNLGANDVPALPAEATWKANYQYIFDAVHTAWSDCKIFIMRPWRRNFGAECNTLASWIADLVTANDFVFTGPDERVFLENGDDGATYTDDGIHPNAAGDVLTAAEWFAVIEVL